MTNFLPTTQARFLEQIATPQQVLIQSFRSVRIPKHCTIVHQPLRVCLLRCGYQPRLKEEGTVYGKTEHEVAVQLRIHLPVVTTEDAIATLIFVRGVSTRGVYHR